MQRPTLGRLQELLDYDAVTGEFIWRKATSRRIRIGNVAGGIKGDSGYRTIGIDGVKHYAHRLAWFFVHGEWPYQIDHEDGNHDNNRIGNLRPVTDKQNQENRGAYRNNRSGYRGVYWSNTYSKWCAAIRHHKRTIHAGYFDDVHEAGLAALSVREQLFTHSNEDASRYQREFAKSDPLQLR